MPDGPVVKDIVELIAERIAEPHALQVAGD
jgi:hypothetical protein